MGPEMTTLTFDTEVKTSVEVVTTTVATVDAAADAVLSSQMEAMASLVVVVAV